MWLGEADPPSTTLMPAWNWNHRNLYNTTVNLLSDRPTAPVAPRARRVKTRKRELFKTHLAARCRSGDRGWTPGTSPLQLSRSVDAPVCRRSVRD